MDHMSNPRLSVVIPIHNEDPQVVQQMELDLAITSEDWEIIVVDDGSDTPYKDATIRTEHCAGYGAAIKAGVRRAKAPLVATIDGDGQHKAHDLKRLESFMRDFPENAMVIGDRRQRETAWVRWIGRKGLNWMATAFAGRWIPDLNSGMRIFKKDLALGYEPILADGFSYTTSMALSMMADGYKVDWVPIRVYQRIIGTSHVSLWRDGFTTARLIVWIGMACRTRKLRAWLRGGR